MSTPPRVLFLCHGHPALVPGGTEAVAHDLFRAWRDAGHDAMFVGCVSRLHREARQDGPVFQTLGRSGDEMLLWVGGFDRFMLAQTDSGPWVAGLGELLAAFRPDIVHVHHFALLGLEALAVIRRLRPQAKIVATLHDYHPICANDGLLATTDAGTPCRRESIDACHACFPAIAPARFAARKLHLRNMLGLVDRFVAPSAFLRDRFVDWGLPADAIELLPNAVPDAAPPPATRKRGPRDRFGVFGNLARHKGTLLALAAIHAIADTGARLHLHGGLVSRDEVFARDFDAGLAAAGPAAAHHGPYARAELPSLMEAIDWVVVPSTWWENAPLVILEAFRHGRPVIAADIGGMAELVEDGVSGLRFRAGDAGDLALVMRRAATEAGPWEGLARRLPNPPTPTVSAARHLALYRALLRADSREAA